MGCARGALDTVHVFGAVDDAHVKWICSDELISWVAHSPPPSSLVIACTNCVSTCLHTLVRVEQAQAVRRLGAGGATRVHLQLFADVEQVLVRHFLSCRHAEHTCEPFPKVPTLGEEEAGIDRRHLATELGGGESRLVLDRGD